MKIQKKDEIENKAYYQTKNGNNNGRAKIRKTPMIRQTPLIQSPTPPTTTTTDTDVNKSKLVVWCGPSVTTGTQ